mgnify:CR=1 FL=1
MKLDNDLLIKAALGQNVERTPVWLMRQAGRILPEYRAIRNSLSGFKELVETPHLAAEVTVQPVDILNVDAAIIFSDILVVPDAMGLSYQMIEKKGPFFEKTVQSIEDVNRLNVPDVEDNLHYVMEAIRITKRELNGRVPLIGFAGAPWTVATYMVAGRGTPDQAPAHLLKNENPELFDNLINLLVEGTIEYLSHQINAVSYTHLRAHET